MVMIIGLFGWVGEKARNINLWKRWWRIRRDLTIDGVKKSEPGEESKRGAWGREISFCMWPCAVGSVSWCQQSTFLILQWNKSLVLSVPHLPMIFLCRSIIYSYTNSAVLRNSYRCIYPCKRSVHTYIFVVLYWPGFMLALSRNINV
jgi:hypothetical protein